MAMSNQQMLIRTAALELYREAHKHDYKGSYAILALASGIHDIAAAILDHNEVLGSIATEFEKCWERNSGEPKTHGRKR